MDRGTPPRRNRPAPPHSQPRSSASRGRRRAANARAAAAHARAVSTTPTSAPPPTSVASHPSATSPSPSPAVTSTASVSTTTATSSTSSAPSTPRPHASMPPRPRSARTKNRQRRRAALPPLPSIAVKLIVRRLPPQLTVEAFAKIADEHGASAAVWRSFFPGAVEATGSVKRTAHVARHSVAYLAFGSMDDATKFYERFNGYVFAPDVASSPASKTPVPSASTRYVASVERSLWQGTPLTRRRVPPPPAPSSIEQDADYLAFLSTLDPTAASPSASTTTSTPTAAKPGSSPASSPASPGGDREEAVRPAVEGRKGKGGAKFQIVTPLMEAVRSRRKERDIKKKSAKAVTRPVRVKGRQVRVVDAPKVVMDSKGHSRRKKRRGVEVAHVERKRDDNDRRGSNVKVTSPTTFAKQGGGGGGGGGASSASGKAHARASTGEGNEGSESSGKQEPRSGGRSRYGRGSRSRGNKYNAAMNGMMATGGGNDHPARQDNVHGTVRLLKKEASNASKT